MKDNMIETYKKEHIDLENKIKSMQMEVAIMNGKIRMLKDKRKILKKIIATLDKENEN